MLPGSRWPATSKAAAATTVFPEPTSPSSSRAHRLSFRLDPPESRDRALCAPVNGMARCLFQALGGQRPEALTSRRIPEKASGSLQLLDVSGFERPANMSDGGAGSGGAGGPSSTLSAPGEHPQLNQEQFVKSQPAASLRQ